MGGGGLAEAAALIAGAVGSSLLLLCCVVGVIACRGKQTGPERTRSLLYGMCFM